MMHSSEGEDRKCHYHKPGEASLAPLDGPVGGREESDCKMSHSVGVAAEWKAGHKDKNVLGCQECSGGLGAVQGRNRDPPASLGEPSGSWVWKGSLGNERGHCPEKFPPRKDVKPQ